MFTKSKPFALCFSSLVLLFALAACGASQPKAIVVRPTNTAVPPAAASHALDEDIEVAWDGSEWYADCRFLLVGKDTPLDA